MWRARFGGEEFVLLLPGCDKHTTAPAFERPPQYDPGDGRAACVAIHWTDHCFPGCGYVSGGRQRGGCADPGSGSAMYTAKRSGRNRVVLAGATGAGSESVAGELDDDNDTILTCVE
jgi:hypothetical protein